MSAPVTGIVHAVCVGQTPGSLVTTSQPAIQLGWDGVVGDLHAGLQRQADARVPHYKRGTPMRNERQVTLVSARELAATAAALGIPHILPEWLGANVLVDGIDGLTYLPPLTRLAFGSGAVLVVYTENLPCRGPGEVIQARHPGKPGLAAGFVKHAMHRRGLIAVVEIPGQIASGDTLEAHLPRGFAWQSAQSPWRVIDT